MALSRFQMASVVAYITIVAVAVSAHHSSSGRLDLSAGNQRLHTIHSSWDARLSDAKVVAAYADFVFVGTVERSTGRKRNFTEYFVRVDDPYASGLSGYVTVSQLGFRDGEEIYQDADQPLLEVGRQYLVAANAEPYSDSLTLIAGPIAGRLISDLSSADRSALQVAVTSRAPERTDAELAERRDWYTRWQLRRASEASTG